jgi:hypothetical protein
VTGIVGGQYSLRVVALEYRPPGLQGRASSLVRPAGLVLRIRSLRIAVVFILIFLLVGCLIDENNTEVGRADSPDRRYVAVVFVRNVDATTDFSTQVSILRYGARLGNGGGDIFICDSGHGRADELKDHSYWMKLTWSSPTALLIQYDQRIRVFKKIDKYKSISISYDPIEVPSTK